MRTHKWSEIKKKTKNYTDITILLDRSGSMSSIKEKVESGFKEFFLEHQKNPSTRVSLVQFNSVHRYDPVFTNLPVTAVEGLDLKPEGGTPLIDAFVKTIDETGARLSRLDEKDRPSRVLFVVITDGEENASVLHTKKDVSDRVNHQRDRYNWQFIYLGANQDAIREASQYGIWAANSGTFSGVEAYSAMQLLGTKTSSYAADGNIRSLTYTDDERDTLVGKNKTKAATP